MIRLKVKKEGIILTSTKLDFEADGVLNPAVIRDEGGIHLFYRAVAKGNYSTIGYCKLSTPLTIAERSKTPVLYPQYSYESQGIEDPRIVKIDNTYYLTYTAFDGINALGALATSSDLISWKKKGILISKITYTEFRYFSGLKSTLDKKYIRFNKPNLKLFNPGSNIYLWDKNVILFPRKIEGKYCLIHRIKPDIQIVTKINNFKELTVRYWRDYFSNFNKHILLSSKYAHEISYIGGGCPPIETSSGWILIYHGSYETVQGYVYCACAALLDLKSPHKVISRLPYPLFKPEKEWEMEGEVNNVCFPTGALTEGDNLYIYYGAADSRIAVASVSMTDLVKELLEYSC